MGVLIQDGRANGHRNWLLEAVDRGQATGAILSPFSTPPEAAPRMPAASTIARDLHEKRAEVIFDATTHGILLPGVDNTDVYNTWNLWAGAVGDLNSADLISAHVGRVFEVQRSLESPLLTPTLPLASVSGPSARTALALAEEGNNHGDPAWQSLAGSRTFWSSGAALDAFVGNLVQLRARAWVLTFIREGSDYPPNVADAEAEAGFARTVHSLSLRSRVIVAHADFFGLTAVAAGADTVGTGWHIGQRVCSADSYIERTGGRNLRYVTHGVLVGRLRPDVATALERTNPGLARALRDNGTYPIDDAGARALHLAAVTARVNAIGASDLRSERVRVARATYAAAQEGWARTITLLPGLVSASDADAWVTRPRAGLERYAVSEGL